MQVRAAVANTKGTWSPAFKGPHGSKRIGSYTPSGIYCRENLDRGYTRQMRAAFGLG